MSYVEVRQRAAGVNLSVDVRVHDYQETGEPWVCNLPVPPNVSLDQPRTDALRIDGHVWTWRVEPGQSFITDDHIRHEHGGPRA